MAVKVKREVSIRVQFVTGLRGAYGDADKIDDDNYLIRIRSRLKPRPGFLTWVHEAVGHVGAWLFAPFHDERLEHQFVAALEKSVDEVWKKYRAGKE